MSICINMGVWRRNYILKMQESKTTVVSLDGMIKVIFIISSMFFYIVKFSIMKIFKNTQTEGERKQKPKIDME